MGDHTLTLDQIETIPREGKTPYFRATFAETYTEGGYTGNQAVLWTTQQKADDLRNAALRKGATFTMKSNDKNPSWSPAIDKVTISGATVYEHAQGQRSNWGGGQKREWIDQSPSMEAQSAIKSAVALVGHFPGLGIKVETPVQAIDYVKEIAGEFYPLLQDLKGKAQTAPAAPENGRADLEGKVLAKFGNEAAALAVAKAVLGVEVAAVHQMADEELNSLLNQ